MWRLYTFDRQLRLCALDAVERVEVWLRARLAHLLARDHGPFGCNGDNGGAAVREQETAGAQGAAEP